MTRSQDVVDRWLEAFNAHDEGGMRSVYADDVIFEAPGEIRLEGTDATVEYALGWLRAFPDAEMRIESQLEADGWIVQRFVFEGTHEDTLAAPTGDIPATNRHMAGRGAQIIRVEDGKVAEDYLYFDQVQVLTQLGLMREPAGHR
ncbi:MAG TPA: ester cyclase [Gaiellaceae bacterium]|nr:ester cyclase [Gaiellaceae bacterium]